MIGQRSLFGPDKTASLKHRVQLQRLSVANARFALEQHHYLRRARTGRQLNYAVLLDGEVDGVLTYAYPMMSAALCGVPSDELLEFARLYLASNTPHVASCAIGKSLRIIERDWAIVYPDAKTPRLVVSWSDSTRHTGVIYKAANFVWLRRVKGQLHGNSPTSKRGQREGHSDYSHDKDCWVYLLDKSVRLEEGPGRPTEVGGANPTRTLQDSEGLDNSGT